MSKSQNTIVTKLIVVATLVLFMVAQHPGVLSSAETANATTAVKHKPLKYFSAGHRIKVEAKVTDPQGVSLVRCYFRAAGQTDFVFVGMKAGEKDTFTGFMPAPAAETYVIVYLFLAVNGKNQVVKTQVFTTTSGDTKDIPAWQSVSNDGAITVSTELPQAIAPQGFSDSITTDVVESSLRFGSVAGIYSTTQVAVGGGTAGGGAAAAGGTSGAAAATSAGTVSASTGLSTMTVAGASVAAVAVAAGVAVATGGGDGDGSGSAISTAPTKIEWKMNIVGTNVSGSGNYTMHLDNNTLDGQWSVKWGGKYPGTVTCQFFDGSWTLDSKTTGGQFHSTGSGTATNTGAPSGYKTSPFSGTVDGTIRLKDGKAEIGSGTWTITYSSSAWVAVGIKTMSGTWTAQRR